MRVRVVCQHLDHTALRNVSFPAAPDHALQLRSERVQASDLAFDLAQVVARNLVGRAAGLMRLVTELQQFADRGEGKSELARVADKGEPIRMNSSVQPLVTRAAGRLGH